MAGRVEAQSQALARWEGGAHDARIGADGQSILVGVLVTVMQKVPLSKPLKYHDKSHKKSVTH